MQLFSKLSYRHYCLFIFFTIVGLLSFGYYLEYFQNIKPCPLCILQRFAFVGTAIIALVGAIQNPQKAGRYVYFVLMLVFLILGAGLAGRQLWLQQLPADTVSSCGASLQFLLENLSLTEVFSKVLAGSGECGKTVWQFLGVSIPGWSLVSFIGFGIVACFSLKRHAAS